LMYWVRVLVSNRLANTGSEWMKVMEKHNSGTYNNQWMVTDFKKFNPGSNELSKDTLWVGEQLPGLFMSGDMTEVVNLQGYWASYNIPYFPLVFELAGYSAMQQEYGSLFSYEACPRANIFRERQGQAQDLESLQTLMRYNDWQHDPLSLGCPENAIAARLDLAPLNFTGTYCAPGLNGAINAKITSSTMVKQLQASIVAGPTHDTQPVFSWTPEIEEQFPGSPHFGQPTTFDFEWLTVSF